MIIPSTQVSSALSEKDKVKSDLAVAQQTSRESSTESTGGASTEEISELQAKIGQLQTHLSEVSSEKSISLIVVIVLFDVSLQKSSQDGASLKEELSKTAVRLNI